MAHVVSQGLEPPKAFSFQPGMSLSWSRLIQDAPTSYFLEAKFTTAGAPRYAVEHLTDPKELESVDFWSRLTAGAKE